MPIRIEEYIGVDNIAKRLEATVLDEISKAVCDGYDIDKESRADWEKTNKEAMKLARQIEEQKNFPFKNAANIKYPLLATASIQFAARAYPNFVKAPDVVKGLVVGDDPDGVKADKAKRVGQHMSYQCLHEMEEWEEDTDKLLAVLPILGCAFKKTWFSSILGRNVSEYRNPDDIVINYWAKSMATVPRISEKFKLYPNEIKERILAGLFIDIDFGSKPSTVKEDGTEAAANDPDQPRVFIEQHTYYDLDKDGYKEPYIITVDKDTKKIVRIVARFKADGIEINESGDIVKINPVHYFTKFSFMPALDGNIYDFGFGALLTPINKVINTTINQLLDAGTWSNAQCGFLGKGIQLGRGRGGGPIEFAPGEWKPVGFTGDDLKKNIFPLPTKEPSLVLFNLLGFMVSGGERLSSVADILSGINENANERPTTTLARIEQGLKVFSSIHKRVYRGFREEYRKLFRLNQEYLNPKTYFVVLDAPAAVAKDDYNSESCDIVPVADPNEVTNTQKMIKAQMLMELLGRGFNDAEIKKRFLEAMQMDEIEKILDAPAPPPDPKIELENRKLVLDEARFEFEQQKFTVEVQEIEAKIEKTLAQGVEILAKAEAIEPGQQLEKYKADLQAITAEKKARDGNNKARVGRVASAKSNA